MDFQDLDHIDGLSISALSADLYKNKRDDLSFELSLNTQVLAPINAMDKAGTIKIIDDETCPST